MQRDCRVSAGTRLWKPRRKSSADGFGGSEDATGRRGSQGQGRVAQAIRLRLRQGGAGSPAGEPAYSKSSKKKIETDWWCGLVTPPGGEKEDLGIGSEWYD